MCASSALSKGLWTPESHLKKINIVSFLGRKRGYKTSHRNSGQVDQIWRLLEWASRKFHSLDICICLSLEDWLTVRSNQNINRPRTLDSNYSGMVIYNIIGLLLMQMDVITTYLFRNQKVNTVLSRKFWLNKPQLIAGHSTISERRLHCITSPRMSNSIHQVSYFFQIFLRFSV